MNHLAHLVLAGPDPDHRLGAFLGDHIKGRAALGHLRRGLAEGIVLHRRIDRWADEHPAVTGLLRQLDSPWRRYGGVILDVLFDHMLTRHWHRFGPKPLALLAAETDQLLVAHRSSLPPRLDRFGRWARSVDLWCRYGDRQMLQEIFDRLGRRHGRPSPLPHGLELLEARDAAIERAFLELFPDLARLAEDFRNGLARQVR